MSLIHWDIKINQFWKAGGTDALYCDLTLHDHSSKEVNNSCNMYKLRMPHPV